MPHHALSLSVFLVLIAVGVLPAQDLSLTSSGYETAVVGQPFSYTIETAPTTSATFSAVGLPAWLTCNASSGVISGTPAASGTVLLAISASDASGTVSRALRIDVNVGSAVVIADPGTLVAQAGGLFNFQIVASGNPTSYQAVGLPQGLALNPTSGFITGMPSTGGSYPVSLIASSALGSWVTSLNLNVYPFVPVVAARTITTTVGDVVRLDISGSNVPTSYSATDLPAGLQVNPSTGLITGVPTNAGISSTTITASNSGGTGSATWTIVVNQSGIGTISLPSPFPMALIGSAYSAQVTANGSPLGYAASGLPTNLSIDASSGAITGTPAAGSGGSYPVLYTATYSSGTLTSTAILTVGPQPPVITVPATVLVGLDSPFNGGGLATNSPTAFSASGLPAGLTINTTTGVVSGSATATGTYAATITASNAGGTTTAGVTVVVLALPAPTAPPGSPVIANAAATTALIGVPFSLSVVATNAPTSYSATNLPPGLTIAASTGVITGTPTATGTYAVALSCGNATGTSSAALAIFVYSVPVTAIATSLANQYATLGTPFSFQLSATYGPATFSASGLPPGLTMNGTTGLISGTPSGVGTYAVIITATNASGTVTDLLSIIVTASPALPDISYATYLVGTVGSPCSFTPRNGSGTSYAATGLPTPLLIDPGTGAITGTPTVAGSSAITVIGTNSSGATTVDATIVINPSGGPGISSPLTTITLAVASQLSYTITSANPSATFAASGLPIGTSVDPLSGVISGAPTAGGSYPVLIFATAGGLTTSAALTMVVTPAPPVITTQELAIARAGEFYYTTIAATDSPTGYAATGLPGGLTLDTSYGTISGTPLTAGTYSVMLMATNAGGSGSATVTLVVNPANAPTLTSATTIYVLPNVAFSYQITTLNQASSFNADGLPAGINVNANTGVVSGTTTALGTIAVVITATNATTSRAALLDIVTVAPGSPGAPASTPPPSNGDSRRCGSGFAYALLMLFMLCAWHRRGLTSQ